MTISAGATAVSASRPEANASTTRANTRASVAPLCTPWLFCPVVLITPDRAIGMAASLGRMWVAVFLRYRGGHRA